MRFRIGGPNAGWRLAGSLVILGRQISEAWPHGGPTDGTVGDLSHQARRSDHNPNAAGVVTALDADEVLEDRGSLLVGQLVASRDPRIKYIIHEGQIWRSYDKPGIPAWTPGDYSGPNAHLNHVHISVSGDPARYDDPSPWNINLDTEGIPEMALTIGDHNPAVGHLQRMLNAWKPQLQLKIDDEYGPKTAAAIADYQQAAFGRSSGIADGETCAWLLTNPLRNPNTLKRLQEAA